MATNKRQAKLIENTTETNRATAEIERAFAEVQPLAAVLYDSTAPAGAKLEGRTVRAHYADEGKFEGDASADLCYLNARTPRHSQSLCYVNPYIASWCEARAALLCGFKLHYDTSTPTARARLAKRFARSSDSVVADAVATAKKGEAAEVRRDTLADYLTGLGLLCDQPTEHELASGMRPAWRYSGRIKAVAAKLAELEAKPFPVGAVNVPVGDSDSNGRGRSKSTKLVCPAGCTHGAAKNRAPVQLAIPTTQLKLWANVTCPKCSAKMVDSKKVAKVAKVAKAAKAA
jgi:hypothetical protein